MAEGIQGDDVVSMILLLTRPILVIEPARDYLNRGPLSPRAEVYP